MWLIITLILTLLYFLHLKLKGYYQYWSNMGVKQGNPVYILGDVGKMVFGTISPQELIQKFYNINKTTRYVGTYQFFKPVLILRDPELIKQIAVKDFEFFTDHHTFASQKVDPLFGGNLLGLKGQEWKDMRAAISPTFTSSKMKQIFSTMLENSEQFVQFFLSKNENQIKLEMKDTFTRFANDLIANTVFGFKCDSLRDPENEFFMMVKDAVNLNKIRKKFVFFAQTICPQLLTFFKITICGKKCDDYFTRIVKENIKVREENKIDRHDMISLLLEARKHQEDESDDTSHKNDNKTPKKYITDEDIVSQAFIFFFAGFDSVSTLLCFMAHELAVNPDIQDKLRKEIDEINEECEGKLTYEVVTNMKYLDMVVTETLRKYPTNIATDRECTKPYTISPINSNEKPVHCQKGDQLFLPIYGIHRDPQYYPEPEKFDPERFSDENKHNIKPYTYIPFGVGPRSCIGNRFALLETKILFYKILLNFEIVTVAETQNPIRYNRKAITMASEKGFWLALKKRN